MAATSQDHGVVLIAESDRATARVMVDWMARAGHDVVCASTSTDALKLADRRHPDVALVAPGLVDADGAGLADTFRRNRTLRRMPVLLVSPDAPAQFTAEAVGDRVRAALRAA